VVAHSDDTGKTFTLATVNHDGWELNACPIDGASLTIDGADGIHVVWFTQSGEEPRLYLASSKDGGRSFSKPRLFDPAQRLAKHAHIVPAGKDRLLIAWDDVADSGLAKWGVFDIPTGSMKILNTQPSASYPIIATAGSRFAVVALKAIYGGLFRTVAAQ
jgi:hypothetical protein